MADDRSNRYLYLDESRQLAEGLFPNISNPSATIFDWEPNYNYFQKDLVVQNGLIYRCYESHIASAEFYLDTSKWIKLTREEFFSYPSLQSNTHILDTIHDTEGSSSFYDYVLSRDGNIRAGSIVLCWSSDIDDIKHYETCTQDIGDTKDFVFDCEINMNTIHLLYNTSINGWSLKFTKKVL